MKIYRILTLIIFAACSTKQDATIITTGKENTIMPSFNMTLEDTLTQSPINTTSKGRGFFLILITPESDYSRVELRRIVNNIKQLKDIDVILIAEKKYAGKLDNFKDEFKLQKHSNIIIAIDKEENFFKYFKPKGVPFSAIYNNQKMLQRVYYGAMSERNILESVNITKVYINKKTSYLNTRSDIFKSESFRCNKILAYPTWINFIWQI